MNKMILSAGLIALAAGTASAGTVQLGVTPVITGTTAMNARLKYDETNWDTLLTGTNDTSGGIATGNIIGNTGSGNNPDPINFAFSLSFAVGQGFTYSVTRLDNNATNTLVWRNDVAANSGSSRNTMGTGTFATDNAFNSIRIDLTANRLAHEVSASNLAFTAAGQTISGSFGNLSALHAGSAASDGAMLVSSMDMRSFNWTLSGNISMTRGGTDVGNPTERLKIDFRGQQITIIPLPASAWAGLGGLGLLGVAQRIRRRRQA